MRSEDAVVRPLVLCLLPSFWHRIACRRCPAHRGQRQSTMAASRYRRLMQTAMRPGSPPRRTCRGRRAAPAAGSVASRGTPRLRFWQPEEHASQRKARALTHSRRPGLAKTSGPGEWDKATDQLRTTPAELSTPQWSTMDTSETSFTLDNRQGPIWGSKGHEFVLSAATVMILPMTDDLVPCEGSMGSFLPALRIDGHGASQQLARSAIYCELSVAQTLIVQGSRPAAQRQSRRNPGFTLTMPLATSSSQRRCASSSRNRMRAHLTNSQDQQRCIHSGLTTSDWRQ